MGESMSEDAERELRAAVEADESVVYVDDFRTMFMGPGRVLVTADVGFDADLPTGAIDEAIQRIQRDLEEADDRVQRVYIEPELR